MSTLADRVWYAIHCLAREPDGSAPTYLEIEHRGHLPNSFFSKMVRGNRPSPSPKTMANLALALHVDILWLSTGEGHAPRLTGELPPRPGAASVPAWKPDVCQTQLRPTELAEPQRFQHGFEARDRAAKFAAEDGISRFAINRVLSYEYPSNVDPSKLSAADWLDRMREADREIKRVPCRARVDGQAHLVPFCGGHKRQRTSSG